MSSTQDISPTTHRPSVVGGKQIIVAKWVAAIKKDIATCCRACGERQAEEVGVAR
jgi:hypothetical protein